MSWWLILSLVLNLWLLASAVHYQHLYCETVMQNKITSLRNRELTLEMERKTNG